MSGAYYNEIDAYAAQWLRNLISAGHIAAGEVDERSIEDVRPDDLRGFTQCHFFAGIGVWSYALRLAGWPDDRPVWTGSCPCQPFSAAGKGAGFADERHLWPAWAWLVGECRPSVILGEQVASKDIDPWIDLVQADLEAMGYAIGCVPFPSAGVGAPHIRDRAYFMAHADHARPQGRRRVRERAVERPARSGGVARIVAHGHDYGRAAPSIDRLHDVEHNAQSCGGSGLVADTDGRHTGAEGLQRSGQHGQQQANGGAGSGLADADCQRSGQQKRQLREEERRPIGVVLPDIGGADKADRSEPAGPTNGFWRDADWLLCRDEKWRPVEPGTFPLADGAPARVGRLRAYGNAINAQAAAEFIRAAREAIDLTA